MTQSWLLKRCRAHPKQSVRLEELMEAKTEYCRVGFPSHFRLTGHQGVEIMVLSSSVYYILADKDNYPFFRADGIRKMRINGARRRYFYLILFNDPLHYREDGKIGHRFRCDINRYYSKHPLCSTNMHTRGRIEERDSFNAHFLDMEREIVQTKIQAYAFKFLQNSNGLNFQLERDAKMKKEFIIGNIQHHEDVCMYETYMDHDHYPECVIHARERVLAWLEETKAAEDLRGAFRGRISAVVSTIVLSYVNAGEIWFWCKFPDMTF